MDLQAILGDYYPAALQDLLSWYLVTFRDPLMRDQPVWFKSFIWCEMLVQMPFFFVASYALLKKANWIRIPAIFYGVHVATTLVPILAEIVFSSYLTDAEKLTLVGFYYPYLLIPAMFAVFMALNPLPFGKTEKKY
jgi:hypothetical protein